MDNEQSVIEDLNEEIEELEETVSDLEGKVSNLEEEVHELESEKSFKALELVRIISDMIEQADMEYN